MRMSSLACSLGNGISVERERRRGGRREGEMVGRDRGGRGRDGKKERDERKKERGRYIEQCKL